MACRGSAGLDLDQGRHDVAAWGDGSVATRMKAAARRARPTAAAADREYSASSRPRHGGGRLAGDRAWPYRDGADRASTSRLGPRSHNAPGIHDGDRIAGLRHDAEIMGDQDNRQAAPVAQIEKEPQDLRLHRDIERGRRLIGNEEIGLAGERQRDHRALAHAAGELMRISHRPGGRGSGMPTCRSKSTAARLASRRLGAAMNIARSRRSACRCA